MLAAAGKQAQNTPSIFSIHTIGLKIAFLLKVFSVGRFSSGQVDAS